MNAPIRFLSSVAAVALAACLLATGPSALAESASTHWVGTWATAVVARPQGPQGLPQGFGPPPPPPAPAPQGQPAVPPPVAPAVAFPGGPPAVVPPGAPPRPES